VSVAIPIPVTSGDFNGDGKQDLAVGRANVSGPLSGVSVLLGNGDGTSRQPSVTASVLRYLCGLVTTGDFNGDGKFGSGYPPTERCERAPGHGTVLSRQPSSTPPVVAPGSVTSGDFNGDGRLDLAVVTQAPTTCTSCWATATAPSCRPSTTASVHPILVTERGLHRRREAGSGRGQFVLPHRERGSWALATASPASCQLRRRSQPELVTSGDLNGDGKLDLATVNADNQ